MTKNTKVRLSKLWEKTVMVAMAILRFAETRKPSAIICSVKILNL